MDYLIRTDRYGPGLSHKDETVLELCSTQLDQMWPTDSLGHDCMWTRMSLLCGPRSVGGVYILVSAALISMTCSKICSCCWPHRLPRSQSRTLNPQLLLLCHYIFILSGLGFKSPTLSPEPSSSLLISRYLLIDALASQAPPCSHI